MTPKELLREMSFDEYERYLLLEHIGKFFRPSDSAYRVLIVTGDRSSPADTSRVAALAGGMILGAEVEVNGAESAAGLRFPYPGGAFHLVCALETLEHLTEECREALLAELVRVTRDGLYLTFPFDSESNRWARQLVAECTRAPQGQLDLPNRHGVSQYFAGLPYAWTEFMQGNTDVWLLMMLTYHSLRASGISRLSDINERFNQAYAAHDWAEPCYRAGYLFSKRRSAADLKALCSSFASADARADLEGVLALCRLFVTIERDTRAREQAQFDGQLSVLAGRLAALDEQIGALRIQLEATTQEQVTAGLKDTARLDRRLRDLEIGLVSNKRAIQAIYDSRIWNALRWMGGLLLRIAGPRAARGVGMSRVRAQSAPVREPVAFPPPPEVSDEFVTLVCEYPGDDGVLPVRDVVEIRGWALAPGGIERVTIQIGNDSPVSATYGIPRPDIAARYPRMAEAEYAGFRFFWDTRDLPEGPCSVRVTAISRSGHSREAVCKVLVDWKTPPDYGLWIVRHEPTAEDLSQMRRQAARFALRPRISIAVPVYKTPPDLLRCCLDSVLAQTYAEWELCLADDASGEPALTATLDQYARSDTRIKLAALRKNQGISGATNAALRLATGDYVAFLDHDDELAPFALFEVVRAINQYPDTDVFYSDEDKIDEQGRRYDAFFKPDWSPDLFRSCNYVCHFVVMKRELVDRTGGLNPAYSGSQDYEFLLRASEQTRKIRRIPKILYHWRAVAGSTARGSDEKPSASEDGRTALAAYLERNAPGAEVEEVAASCYRVRYPINGEPAVSILIPTGGYKGVFRAVEDVLAKTSYKNYEIVVIDNSHASRVADACTRWTGRKAPVRYLDWRDRPFNFAAMNNAAVRAVDSTYVLFLNDDTSVITPEWLTAMLEHAQRPEVGAVGAQLWYPNDLIQHAGVIMGIFGNCSHAFKGMPGGTRHYFDFANLIRNCSAVTGACMLVARRKFLEAGAFDEANLAVAFQDVDLCLKLLGLGYYNVYTPYARLYHFESASKTDKDKVPDAREDAFMKNKWAKYIADDPYYNPHLARQREDFSLALD